MKSARLALAVAPAGKTGECIGMHGSQPIGLSDVLQRCEHCSVRHRAVCGAMDSVQIGKLARMAHRRKIPAGQTIVSDGEPVDFFANIVSGAVKLIKTLPDGRQQIVGLLFAPDFLGLTIETVSRQLTRLKMANVILLGSNRLIMVPNADHLAQAAGQHDLLH